MGIIKEPCVAGFFYPANPVELQQTVNNLLDAAEMYEDKVPKALIAPHAGYIYSGPIAATIYKTLVPARDKIKRVVLLGPAHRVYVDGLATTNCDFFATPLGSIAIDTAGIQSILKLPGVQIFDQAFNMEHSLEVQLPFLQTVLNSFTLVPLVVGNADPEMVANVIEHLWGGPETLIVISSDLSHYYDYVTAQKLDSATSQAIVELNPEKIGDNQACGRFPMRGLLVAAARRNLHAKMLDLRNSGDTAGDKTRVVGYGAYHFI